MIIIHRGQSGYTPTDNYSETATPKEAARKLNETMGITPAQEEAMVAGSMFGWAVPGADPKNYDEEGHAIRPKQKDRGDAR